MLSGFFGGLSGNQSALRSAFLIKAGLDNDYDLLSRENIVEIPAKTEDIPITFKTLPRNVWATSLTSFFMDISSEMVINLLPLFLANVLGLKTNLIGLIEGVAEATSSLLKIFSGWLSDRLGTRKNLAVAGYGISALVKPFFYLANGWGIIAAARWGDRVGKGIRTAPRDALIADSVQPAQRGLAFGFQRAADTAGAMCGLLVALGVVWLAQANTLALSADTFRTLVLISLVPAILAVLVLAVGAQEVAVTGQRAAPKFAFSSLGRPFMVFMVIIALFELGNSSDAFLVLRAQERGLSVMGVLGMLVTFNLVYTLISTPAGLLSDRIDRRWVIGGGWLAYAAIYLGFGLAQSGWQIWLLYTIYGLYYGLAYGTTKALIADLVPSIWLGTAYGTYNALMGVLDFVASVVAGVLWQGIGSWNGFGAPAPFLFGAGMALLATLLLVFWLPRMSESLQF
ncbi:MAG: MFS transporter [Anaerolineae bacterium]|nr:MFS transporter [Anaerolineae bacterium]